MKKTKIVCTMGPTTNSKDIIKDLILNGMNAARLNFSHGNYEEHKGRIDMVKEAREELGTYTALLLDTKGPEIRTGDIEGDTVELKAGDHFVISCGEDIVGSNKICSVSHKILYREVKPGDVILIDDGAVSLKVEDIEHDNIVTLVENTGFIGSHKGVNVPGVKLSLPALTDKDISDILFGIENGVDIIAVSFVRNAEDVQAIRNLLNKNGGNHIQIFSKIENKEGVDNIDDIIKLSEGIMVARGDLGVEIPAEDVPEIQKMIIRKCNIAGKTVITATQMLDSMIRNPRPTRAEASDVANAILDGSDAIMLSGETANGKYPVEALQIMNKLAERTESYINYRGNFEKRRKQYIKTIANAISVATCKTAIDLEAKAVITATQSGQTARQISKYRPECNIIACTPHVETARSLALTWGVHPILISKAKDTDELIEKSSEVVLEEGLVEKGDLVVFAAGIPLNYIGSTNMMKVHIIGNVLIQGHGSNEGEAHGVVKYASDAKDLEGFSGDDKVIIVTDRLSKSIYSALDKVAGIIVDTDELSKCVVDTCNERKIPIIYDAHNAIKTIKEGCFITMDGKNGMVYNGSVSIK